MALVAYGSSDESDSEEEETVQKVSAPANKIVETAAPKPRGTLQISIFRAFKQLYIA